jgi:hypothetical protein
MVPVLVVPKQDPEIYMRHTLLTVRVTQHAAALNNEVQVWRATIPKEVFVASHKKNAHITH